MAMSSSVSEIGIALQQRERPVEPVLDFDEIYDEHADYLWSVIRRLGLSEPSAHDALQEVFFIVFRKLDGFEGRSTLRTWLYGITLKVVRAQRRRQRWKRWLCPQTIFSNLADTRAPDEEVEKAEAVRILDDILEQFPDERREVFVLSEIEGLTAKEISEAVDCSINTVYSRLRLARKDFEQSLKRHESRDTWRLR